MALWTAALLVSMAFISCVLAFVRTRDLAHPTILVTLFLVVPAVSTKLHWSYFQVEEWDLKTQILILQVAAIFLFVPLAMAWNSRRSKDTSCLTHPQQLWPGSVVAIVRLMSVGFLALFFLENVLATGTMLPLSLAVDGIDVHTVAMPGLLWITRNAPVFAALEFIVWSQRKSKLDLLLTTAIAFVQVTRLGRIDVYMALVTLIVAASYVLPPSRTRRKMVLLGLPLVVCAIILAGNLFTHFRWTQGYRYELSYATVIGFQGPNDGVGLLPILYGYFSLSYENLNRVVHTFNQSYTWPYFMFRPVWGLLQFHNLFGYDLSVSHMYDPLMGAANVPTALAEFYVDAGPFAFLPAMLYALFLGWLYVNKGRSLFWCVAYAVYAGAVALFSFQALIIAPPVFFGLLLLPLLALIRSRSKLLSRVPRT